MPWLRVMNSTAILLIIVLVSGFAFSEKLMNIAESSTFPDPIIYSASTPYQRIIITGGGKELKLFLNGNLQFNSRDEYRYHEALVHPAMASLKEPTDALVLGGGDGMAVREILKYPSIKNVTLVDLDHRMTDLFRTQDLLSRLNNHSLQDPRVKVITQDAFVWLKKSPERFDFIAVDFPDPGNFSLGKLYSDTFYKALKNVLKPSGVIVIQSTSPYYAKNSYWCVVETLRSVGLQTTPYHAYVPSFGDWGYVLATKEPFTPGNNYPAGLRYLSPETLAQMLHFPLDQQPTVYAVNRLNNQALVHLFESEWGEYVDVH
jgi:spermidine synthase